MMHCGWDFEKKVNGVGRASADSRNRLVEDVNEAQGTVLSSKVIKTESARLGSTEGTAPLKSLS